MSERKLAAAFIDFENFYFSLTNLYELTYRDAGEVIVSLIASKLDQLKEEIGEFIIRQAFADWSTFQESKKELQRIGIRIFDFLSTEYKNSADIELSLAVLETVITRDDIDTIVIFAGDRDYMPVALRARERGRNLHFVGFEKSLSGDVKSLVGEANYSYVVPEGASNGKKSKGASKAVGEKETALVIEGLDENEVKGATAAIKAYDKYEDRFGCVKVSVFLVEGLAEALPELEHFQRKQVFSSLVDSDVVKTSQKIPESVDLFGRVMPYAVFVPNEDHEAVKAIRDGVRSMVQAGRELLKIAARNAATKDGVVLGANLGNRLKELDPMFSPRKYGFENLTEFIERNPDILAYEGVKSGGDKKYLLVNSKS